MKPLDHVPTRLLPRLAATGRIAASLGKAGAKRLLRRSDEDARQLGDEMLRELDQLKGIAMKVGQILSYMDVALPEATAERLARLQTGSRPLDVAVIRSLIEQELGAPVADLFDSFDPEPVAAASIGQVHRARLRGADVAIKVRYPGVRETVDSDFRQLAALGQIASLGAAVDGPALVQELRDRMLEECDYGREAAWQQAFAERFAPHPSIDVPAVIADRSAEGVLTTAWRTGETFEQLRSAPAERRNAVGATLIRFAFESLLGGGALQADPHPGNFLFPGGERVVALDFGCVKPFDAARLEAWRALGRIVTAGDRAGFDAALLATGQVGHLDRFDFDESWELHRWLHAPWYADRFRFEPGWLRSGARFTGPRAHNARHMALPPEQLWLMRAHYGLHAVLAKLGVEGSFRELFAGFLDLPCRPIPGPRGN